MDFVVNHCSEEHEWFIQSIKGVKPYDEYFIWMDPKGYDDMGNPIPPNNWISLFMGSMWEWNGRRKQFYLHQFSKEQPDLNLRNPLVKNEIKSIITFWFDKGISGLRLDATRHYIEDELFRDELLLNPKLNYKDSEIKYDDLEHISYTTDCWESYQFTHELREFVDDINMKRGGYERILIAEAYTTENLTMAYYGSKDYKITHYPFNFEFVRIPVPVTANTIDTVISNWLKHMPKGETANWVSENHDRRRLGSRLSEEHSELILLMTMMLPGVVCLYYGQEIGMPNGPIRKEQIRDTYGEGGLKVYITRDLERTPMQWDDSMNSGFTSRLKPWLPVNPNYCRINVETQKKQKMSHYNLFKHLSHLRKSETCKNGEFDSQVISEWVYLFSRYLPGHPTYYVVVNVGKEYEILDLDDHVRNLPPTLVVETGTINSGYTKGHTIKTRNEFPYLFVLKPYSAVVLTTNFKD